MSFLREKIIAELPKALSQKVFQLEELEEDHFKMVLQELIASLSDDQLNLIVEYEVGNEHLTDQKRIIFLQYFLIHSDEVLREKAIAYLEPYLKAELVPLVEPLLEDDFHNVRVRVYWVLAKYSDFPDLLEMILLDFNIATEDNELILLAAALYLLNNDPTSYGMRFLKEYYLEHYFDLEKNELKVSLTGYHGYPAQIIGLILWEAGIKLYKRGSLEQYNLRWLISKD